MSPAAAGAIPCLHNYALPKATTSNETHKSVIEFIPRSLPQVHGAWSIVIQWSPEALDMALISITEAGLASK